MASNWFGGKGTRVSDSKIQYGDRDETSSRGGEQKGNENNRAAH